MTIQEVDYFAVLDDGTSENFRCRRDMSLVFASKPNTRYAALLGVSDGIPGVAEVLCGDDLSKDHQSAKDFAQDNL